MVLEFPYLDILHMTYLIKKMQKRIKITQHHIDI